MKSFKEGYRRHWIIYTLILTPIAAIAGFLLYLVIIFSIIRYADRPQNDEEDERIANIIPFSQRGLPVPATDVPVTLPPDPGEAGKATLVGIDSNNDGVRDDLEREIVYMYPQNEEIRRVLRAEVKKIQDVIVTEGDHEHFKSLMISAFTFKNCYIYKAFPPNVYDPINQQILWNMAANTKARAKAQKLNEDKATPFSSVAGGTAYECEIVKGQY